MSFPSVTHTFTNGTSADATQVNTNFTDIINGLSDGTKSLTMDQATFGGAVTLNGALTIGNGVGDDVTITGSLASSIPIKTNNSFDIGSATLGLAGIYLGAPSSRTTRVTANQSIGASHTLVLPSGGGTNYFGIETDGSGNLRYKDFQNTSDISNNIGITCTVGSNNMTVALKQADGTDASTGSSAIRIAFRSSTLNTGTSSVVAVTAALSMTIDSGATLGSTSGKAHRIYVYALNNAGTVELAVSGSKIDENILYTTTALDTSSDDAGGLYSDTARSNVAIRLLGSFLHTQATAGTYLTVPSEVYVGSKLFSFSPTIVVTAASYTATSLVETILCDCTSNAITVNLPTGSGLLGKKYKIVKTDSSTNAVTIDGSGTETINGRTALTLTGIYEFIEIVGDNSNFVIISENRKHCVSVYDANGYGSTNTRIRRFGSTTVNKGDAITYADSASLGASFTINEAGTYSIHYGEIFSTGEFLGITLNSSQLTTDISGVTASTRLAIAYHSGGDASTMCSVVINLVPGDVIRPHTAGTATGGSGTITNRFSIAKVA